MFHRSKSYNLRAWGWVIDEKFLSKPSFIVILSAHHNWLQNAQEPIAISNQVFHIFKAYFWKFAWRMSKTAHIMNATSRHTV